MIAACGRCSQAFVKRNQSLACADCRPVIRAEYQRHRRQLNVPRARHYARVYANNHKTENRERLRAWRRANPLLVRAQGEKYRSKIANKQKRHSVRKQWWLRNRDHYNDNQWRYRVMRRFGGTLPEPWLVEALRLARSFRKRGAEDRMRIA